MPISTAKAQWNFGPKRNKLKTMPDDILEKKHHEESKDSNGELCHLKHKQHLHSFGLWWGEEDIYVLVSGSGVWSSGMGSGRSRGGGGKLGLRVCSSSGNNFTAATTNNKRHWKETLLPWHILPIYPRLKQAPDKNIMATVTGLWAFYL